MGLDASHRRRCRRCRRIRGAGRTGLGRSVGVGIAVLSMLANFVFIPYYPVWSLLIIALNVFVIWALIAYKR